MVAARVGVGVGYQIPVDNVAVGEKGNAPVVAHEEQQQKHLNQSDDPFIYHPPTFFFKGRYC